MPTIDPEKMIVEALQKAKDCFTVGELEYGEEILTQILRCDPDNQAATQLMGVFLHRVKRYEEAMEFFHNAIDFDPDNPDNYNNLALCVTSVGRIDDAIRYLKDAISMNPKEAKYYNNLGLQYRQKRMYKEAIDSLLSAKKLDPKNPQIMSNIGGIMGETHELEKAKRAFKRALEFDPEFASAHVDLAYTLQLMGNREDAWSHYEYRFKVFENLWFYNNKYDPNKRWKDTKEDLNNKTLILYCEQGLGDAIQFVRYIPIIKERHHCKVYLHCSDVLKSLFAAQNLGIDDFMTESIISIMPDQMPTHDLHASIMSLPYLLGNPSVQGSKYIKATNKACLNDGKKKIAICWAGSPQHPNDSIRSCHLRLFRSLAELPDVKLYSFQQNYQPRHQPGVGIIDYTEGGKDFPLVDMSQHMKSFEDTVNLLTDIDLVVTVDTALLHVAGAMGIPTMAILSYNPDWRWEIKGKTTDWYDSVRLFRQPEPGNWEVPFKEMIEEVKSL